MPPKYIAFLYLPKANKYIYSLASDDFKSVALSKKCHYTVVYRFVKNEFVVCEQSSPRYTLECVIKGEGVPSDLPCRPLENATQVAVPVNYERTAFQNKWFFS